MGAYLCLQEGSQNAESEENLRKQGCNVSA